MWKMCVVCKCAAVFSALCGGVYNMDNISFIPLNKKSKEKDCMVRVPVTREGLAVLIAQGKATKAQENLFYYSIERLIYAIISRYGKFDSRREFSDIVGDIYLRLRDVLHTYDPAKGKFITWMWKVGWTTVVGDRYRYVRYCRVQKLEGLRSREYLEKPVKKNIINRTEIKMDFYKVLLLLHERMPQRKGELIALFGDPFSENYIIPESINFTRAARNSKKFDMIELRNFFNKHVYPFFNHYLGDSVK